MLKWILVLTLALLLLTSAAWSTEQNPAPEEAPWLETVESRAASGEPEGLIRWVGKGLSLHEPNYLLPLTWSNRAEGSADAETVFQFSFKQQLGRTRCYLAYTQKSFWRVLDRANSRPFRETNHNPELFYRYVAPSKSWGTWGADAGYEHESNGSSEPDSRSWDRLYLKPFVSFERLRLDLKLWYRIPEDEKTRPEDTRGDENPDIERYYGYGELRLAYMFSNRWQQDHMASLLLRFNPATGKGGMRFDYTLPTPSRYAFFVAQIWTGYGESLIDYNRDLTRYGIGVMFKR